MRRMSSEEWVICLERSRVGWEATFFALRSSVDKSV